MNVHSNLESEEKHLAVTNTLYANKNVTYMYCVCIING